MATVFISSTSEDLKPAGAQTESVLYSFRHLVVQAELAGARRLKYTGQNRYLDDARLREHGRAVERERAPGLQIDDRHAQRAIEAFVEAAQFGQGLVFEKLGEGWLRSGHARQCHEKRESQHARHSIICEDGSRWTITSRSMRSSVSALLTSS